jgi:hypothetical protein
MLDDLISRLDRLASGRVAFMEGYLEQLGREITRGAT